MTPKQHRKFHDLFWIVTVVLLGLWAYFLYMTAKAPNRGLGPGDPIPTFTVYTQHGQALASESLKGKIVLLHFWATWCGPCQEEMPKLEGLLRALKDNTEFVPLIVSIDLEGKKETDPFRNRFGITIPFHYDPDAKAAEAFHSDGIPESYLIGRDGVIVRKWTGPAHWSDPQIRAEIEARL